MHLTNGMTAIVTGASKGLGTYIAQALASRGVNLVLTARSREKLQVVQKEVESTGVKVLTVPTDLSDPSGIHHVMAETLHEYGSIDVLVNNAGLEVTLPYNELRLSEIEDTIRINLMAPMMMTRLVLPRMLEQRRGHIVNISSASGLIPTAYGEPYTSTKFGLVGFTRSLRLTAQASEWPIGASVICPGFMHGTGMYEDVKKAFGVKAPWYVGSLGAERIGPAVLHAIEHNDAEVLLMPGFPRFLQAFSAFVPEAFEWMARKIGLYRIFQEIAEHRLQQRADQTTSEALDLLAFNRTDPSENRQGQAPFSADQHHANQTRELAEYSHVQ